MPVSTAKVAGKQSKVVKLEDDEDIKRMPDSAESSSDEEPRGNIKPTYFIRSSQGPGAQASKSKAAKNGTKPATVNGARKTTRSAKEIIASTQDSGSSSPKRKSQDDPPVHGSSMLDSFGRVRAKKAKTTFGSSQPTSSYGRNPKKDMGIKIPENPPDSPQTPGKGFNVPSIPEDSPVSTPGSNSGFVETTALKDDQSPILDFKHLPKLDDSMDELPTGYHNSSPTGTRKTRGRKTFQPDEPATQIAPFKIFEGLDELSGTAEAIIDEDPFKIPSKPQDELDDDIFATMTQRARCPMCKKPVDPEDLRAFGNMNTRKQEKFCQSHQKKTAQEEWELKEYPEIDWEKLGSRISKHYSFIRRVINGGESHYRDLLEDKVNAGKDRSLMKMTSNLTPGYYGARGLRAISENIMLEFTSLIKKKAVKDRRISSRGPTAFVQSVLVPEVAVLLIMEDMHVKADKAREILDDSAGIGELIHEEIRDVVRKRVEDSEEDSDFD
ncbi:hypothetical protein LCER1_G002920 [Lachnellula cervina]|uniref:Restriction of telomere capping protein 4 n=1 Tax=Lachnellula cervina TaxID=1316786 RepID=A0A7D8YYW9_9HELO|nr:hypothetical protein LCER1_G002920 [Lachnellula cervina]